MAEGAKELLKALYEIGSLAENCMLHLQTAFIYNSVSPLNNCYESIEIIKNKEPELTKRLTELARTDQSLKPYISVPVHYLRISENMEKLSELINKKIKEDILFSDKAVMEITFLFERLMDMLKPVSDLILAKNIILSKYVQESESGVVKNANEYATLHEERLIEGLCLPFASAIYINMLDAIKNIAWHAKEIAVKIVSQT